MKVTRTSPISGKTNTKTLDITEDQIKNWQNGELLQNAFPNLTSDEREFFKSGITAEEWEEMFK